MKFLKYGALLAMFFAIKLNAQTDSTLKFSLQEAQNYAIENFFVSKNAELDVLSAKKKVWETTAIGLPQVSTNADWQFIPNPPTIDFPGGPNPGDVMSFQIAPEHNVNFGATVSQLIFSGEYIVGLQASRTYKTFSEENYEKVRIDLRESIAGSYYAILVLEANYKVLTKTLQNLKDNLSEAEKTFEAGLIDDTEVDQLKLTFKRTESNLASLENQIKTLRNLFKYQLGVSSDAIISLTDEMDNLILTNIISNADYIFNLYDNIDYRILSTNEDLQRLSLNREKSYYLPTVAGFYRYSDQTAATEFSPTINHVLGVSVNWNIFQSGMRLAKVSQARIELEKATNMKDQEAERLVIAAQQAKYNYQTALAKYHNEKSNFELSEKVFDKTRIKHEQGMASSLELSIVNTQFLTAQISYSTAIQQLLTSKTALDKAYNKL